MEERASQNNAQRLDDFRQGRFLLANDQGIQGTRAQQQDRRVAMPRQSANFERPERKTAPYRNDRSRPNISPQSFEGRFNPDKQSSFVQREAHEQRTGISNAISERQTSRTSLATNNGFNNENMRRQRLEEARAKTSDANENKNPAENNEKIKKPLGLARKISSATSPKQMLGMAKQIHILSDMPYVFAIAAALLKDVLDLAFIGSLPAIGTVITICISIFIFFMLLLSGSSGKRGVAKGMIKKIPVLVIGTAVEMFFGINFIPVETATVALIYAMDLKDRAQIAIQEDENEGQGD